ncbi:MAG TPA: hypothetical protein DIW64_18790 [Cellvibrio sp.]|nr:hypothetical protein [Cellvibrio sp.]
MTGGKFKNGAATAAMYYVAQWAVSRIKAGGSSAYGERGTPDGIDESYLRKNPRLKVTRTVIDGETHAMIEGNYDYENMTVDEAKQIELTIEEGFYKTFLGDGTRVHVYLDLRYDPNAPKPIVFRKAGVDVVSYMSADVGGKNININADKFTAALNDKYGVWHEFGHILGFQHANNGSYDLMSYDAENYFQRRHFDMINKKY